MPLGHVSLHVPRLVLGLGPVCLLRLLLGRRCSRLDDSWRGGSSCCWRWRLRDKLGQVGGIFSINLGIGLQIDKIWIPSKNPDEKDNREVRAIVGCWLMFGQQQQQQFDVRMSDPNPRGQSGLNCTQMLGPTQLWIHLNPANKEAGLIPRLAVLTSGWTYTRSADWIL